MIVCARDLPLPAGVAIGPGPELPTIPVPTGVLEGAGLDPLLSYGWHRGGDGALWSEGPRGTLLFRATSADDGPLRLRLMLDGIAQRAGGSRTVAVRVGEGPAHGGPAR